MHKESVINVESECVDENKKAVPEKSETAFRNWCRGRNRTSSGKPYFMRSLKLRILAGYTLGDSCCKRCIGAICAVLRTGLAYRAARQSVSMCVQFGKSDSRCSIRSCRIFRLVGKNIGQDPIILLASKPYPAWGLIQGSVAERLIAFDESMKACGSDTTRSLPDLDEYQLALVDESIDGGPGNPKFGFGGMYSIKQCLIGRLQDLVSAY